MHESVSATCYFLVLQKMHFPVQAEPGEYLSIWSVGPNVWVIDPTGEWVVRRTSFPEGKLWSTLDALLDQGVIRYLDDDEHLRRPLPTADVPSRPTLRVIRVG